MSEEKSKGISLRKKKSTRPKISAPKQISTDSVPAVVAVQESGQQDNGSSIRPAVPRVRPGMGGDNTTDLVKRRYSTRFAQLPLAQDGSVPPVPSMPALPKQYQSSSPSRDGAALERTETSRLRVDINALRDSNLQPEQYVAKLLADATEQDIHDFQRELGNVKHHTSTDLQHNVYQNRTQFIKISKEAEKLKDEMRTLRSLMSELTSALGQATAAGGEASSSALADRKRRNRTSVANLEALWSTHLQALWKRVEGSQKYLPAIPGRHIVHESSRWVELNAATWKPRRRAHLILLNDHLLVASEKKRLDLANASPKNNRYSTIQPQTQLVAERCWPLQDVQLADISARSPTSLTHSARDGERSAIANAINIRVGSESWTFATTSASDSAEKAALLVTFRKAAEDLRKNIAAEHGEREKAMDELAYLTGRDPGNLKKPIAKAADGAADGGVSDRNNLIIDVDGRQQSLRWVDGQIDGLDIDIGLQRFEESVSRTEKLRKLARSIKGNTVAQDIIVGKIDERAAKLANLLTRQLVETSGQLTATQQNVGWMSRLGYEEVAREAYLEARKSILHKRTRQLPFTGSLPPFISALSYLTFTLLLHTFRTFSASFPAPASSAVVKWAKERLDEFNDVLGRQLSEVARDGEVWEACVLEVKRHAEVLKEVGVDFRGLVGKGLGVDVDGSEALPVRRREEHAGLGVN
ncbi:exocyst complex component exo84 [Elasticomyces elasticus]|nr:exocyst complex component exo84 [Elasticomyces elasticus]